MRRSERSERRLPPAIRPGLHCGSAGLPSSSSRSPASPGHQAGAPLRPRHPERVDPEDGCFPRPSGRGSIAAEHEQRLASGARRLPPAIRPGLHCGADGPLPFHCNGGTFPRPSGRGSIAAWVRAWAGSSWVAASPGHQAGAPLRPLTGWGFRLEGLQLPPAIRPGLHCGDPVWNADRLMRLPSPGHQAGAPLRLLHVGAAPRPRHPFPRPSGRGSIAAVL